MFYVAKGLRSSCLLVLLIFWCSVTDVAEQNGQQNQLASQKPGTGASQPLTDILQYISASWDDLTRSLSKCSAYTDTKTDGEPVLYLPVELPVSPALRELEKQCKVRVEHLPNAITSPGHVDLNKIRTEGLLYLDNPYVVPGGQFNEMYGWDSYFIIRGLFSGL
jgi:alpha,alpha-trehalase